MTDLAPRSPRRSFTEMTELVLPQHANAIGTAFGGTVMGWIDVCAAVAAQRHCGRVAVTAFVDDLVFQAPIKVGDVVRLTARLNAAFHSSMEVACVVEVEDPATLARTRCVEALLVFVNLDDEGKPLGVPPLAVETEEDEARLAAAGARRAERRARR